MTHYSALPAPGLRVGVWKPDEAAEALVTNIDWSPEDTRSCTIIAMNQSVANHTKVRRLHGVVHCSVQKLIVAKYYTQTNYICLSVSQHEFSDVFKTVNIWTKVTHAPVT